MDVPSSHGSKIGIGKKEIIFNPKEDEGERACSVASSQTSQVSATIQRIYNMAGSKKMPFFLLLFFQVIGF